MVLNADATTAVLPGSGQSSGGAGAACALIAALPCPSRGSHHPTCARRSSRRPLASPCLPQVRSAKSSGGQHQWRQGRATRARWSSSLPSCGRWPSGVGLGAGAPRQRDARQLHTLQTCSSWPVRPTTRGARCATARPTAAATRRSLTRCSSCCDDLEDMCDLLKEYALRVAGAPADATPKRRRRSPPSVCRARWLRDGLRQGAPPADHRPDGGPTANISTLTAAACPLRRRTSS